MNIIGTQYSLQQKALEIYLAGCLGPHCAECHNQETWPFDVGTPYCSVLFHCSLQQKLDAAGTMVRHIMVMGGEPLDQPLEELLPFLDSLKQSGKDLWLFTRRELREVPRQLQDLCDYIKTGPYIPGRPPTQYNNLTLASDNQKVYCFINPVKD
jgi:anaerobic ribonucleoside-triphosphate reductase activating protein